MTICDLSDSPAIELYFYDELDAAERTRVQAHVADCPECRRRLDDLQAIRRALAALPRVEAPAAGDWSRFMQRLDRSCGIPAFDASGVAHKSSRARWPLRPALAIAATLMLVTIGAVVATRFRTEAPTSKAAMPPVASRTAPPAQPTIARTPGRALAELSEQHFERSKLVVLDLASRDPEHTSATDWAYERDLAGSLLSDTRLYRLAAKDRGLQDIARVMGDLETVLLEASMSDDKDPAALERVQKLIRKRDLVVKMQVVGSAGI